MEEEIKLGEGKSNGYVVPVDERYKIIPTSDTKWYIYDYLKYTTVVDENGKIIMFPSSYEAHRKYDQLVAAYQREYPRLKAEAEKAAGGRV